MARLAIAVLALLALPPSAFARVTMTQFKVAPSSLQAGGHPSVKITQAFAYSNTTDDGKDAFVRLGPGLLGNPQNAALCTSEQMRSPAGCPARARIGSVQASARPIVLGLPAPMAQSVPGAVFNLRPKGGEPARIGLALQALGGLTKTYLEAPANLRPGPGGIGLETLFTDQPRDAGVDIQIEGIVLTFDGRASGGPFMRMPTSCAPTASIARVNSYQAPGTFSQRSSAFSATGCDKLGFSPAASGALGAPGAIRKGTRPPLTTTLRFDPEQAALNRAEVTLPKSLSPNLSAVLRACRPATAAPYCPAGARVGTAIIDSPLQPRPVRGSVFLAYNSPSPVPGLTVYLPPPVDLRIDAIVDSTAAGLRNTFPTNPDLPLRSFTLAIDGGPQGLLELNQDLCAPRAPTAIAVELTAHSGKTRKFKQQLTTPGCDPRARVRLRRAKAKTFTLAAVLTAARGGPSVTSAKLALPKGLVRGRPRPRVTVDGRKPAVRVKRRSLALRLGGDRARRVRIAWKGLRARTRLAKRLRTAVTLVDKRKRKTTLRARVFRG
jgi:hypothetical protein